MFLIFLLLTLIGILFNNFVWKRRNLPPGPTPLPIIGNKLSMIRESPGYNAFLRWEKQYGPVYTYWLGELPVIAVTDFSIIEDTFVRDGDAYTGRAFLADFFKTVKGVGAVFGVVNTDGELWTQTRRFSLQILRNLGVGKSVIEQNILHEIKQSIKSIESELDESIVVQNLIEKMEIAVGSIINQLTFGFAFHGERAADFRDLKNLAQQHMNSVSELLTRTVIVMPKLRYFPIFSGAYKRAEARILRLYAFYDRQIDATIEMRRNTKDCDDAPKYFVDAFLRQIENVRGTADEKYFKKNLRGICQDLFVAGQDTTANTLAFVLNYMIRWPHIQQRMQDELDVLVKKKKLEQLKSGGSDCFFITNSDRSHLPYTNAVINETQRFCNLVPENLLHKTTRDVTVAGHFIPKGTRIIPQISCVLYNEKIFPDARSFKPERFLTDDGKLKKIKEFIPFSVGKRQCLGESLAKMELFLITANLFYRYQISAVDSENPPSLDKISGVAVRPNGFMCRVKRRI